MEEFDAGGFLGRTYKIYLDADGYLPQCLEAVASFNSNEFLGWYDSNQNLIFTDSRLFDQDIDHYAKQHIYASFSGEAKPNDTKTEVTIKICRGRWDGTGWHNRIYKGKIGFALDQMTYADQTIVVKVGESVTVYAQGDEGNNDSDYGNDPWWYYITGFYNINHSPYKIIDSYTTLQASYTFQAMSDRTIYVDFQYYH